MADRYRKKPVVIEAMQFDGTVESSNAVLAWIGSNGGGGGRISRNRPEDGLFIATLEGDMRCGVGWWVIQGIAGEFYPCEPAIFEATYEAVDG